MIRVPLPQFKTMSATPDITEIYNWGLIDLNIPQVHKKTMGEGIKIGVVDTGKSDHFEVQNNTAAAANFTTSNRLNDRHGHSCLHPQGRVFTTRNGLETIENFYSEIKKPELGLNQDTYSKYIGDLNIQCLSYCKENDIFGLDKIVYVHKIPVSDDILHINFGKKRYVKLTKDHPTYIIDNKKVNIVPASELKIGQSLIANNNDAKSLNTKEIEIEYSLCRECQHCGHVIKIIKEHNGRRQCKKCGKASFIDKSFKRLLNTNWAYMAGLLASDGHLHYDTANMVQISNRNQKIIDNVHKFLSNAGYKVKIYKDNRDTRPYEIARKSLVVCSKEIVEFFISIGIMPGKKTRLQELPLVIQTSPLNVIYAFLGGVIDGDGSTSKERKVRISSGSIEFCKQMVYFLISIGIRCNYMKACEAHEREVNGKLCNFNEAWHIVLYNPYYLSEYIVSDKKDALRNTNVKRIKNIRVSSIQHEFFDGYFYDFTTEKNHNYQGNGVVISNTFISGIIAAQKNDKGVVGVAPKAKLYFAKAIEDSGAGNPESLIQAIDWCIKQRVDIISISAGIFYNFLPLYKIIKKAYDRNIIIVAATGNTGTAHFDVAFPARYQEVIGVGAYDREHKIAPFSSRGMNVMFALPGVDLYSTYLDNTYAYMSGTSFSAPIMAGVCALILAKHRKIESNTPCTNTREMLEHLTKYSIKLGPENAAGFGSVNVEGLIKED